MPGMKAYEGRSHSKIHGTMTALRRQLGLGLFDKIEPHILRDRLMDTKLSEWVSLPAHLRDCEIDFDLKESLQSEGEAEFDPDERRFRLLFSKDSYKEWIAGNARARFTFCHELAHLAMHFLELVHLRKLPHQEQLALHRNPKPHPAFLDVEVQANSGAGFLSAPAEGCAKLWRTYGGYEPIMETYGISLSAAKMRISNLLFYGHTYGVSL